MDSSYFKYLKRFYNSLYDKVSMANKLKKPSLILTFQEIKSTDRFNLLNSSQLNISNIPRSVIQDLHKNKYIRPSLTGDLEYYIITGFGIWEVESKDKTININLILEHLDKKFFYTSTVTKTINDKEKILLLSMIAVRSFSEKASVNLNTDDEKMLAYVKELLEGSFELLNKHNITKNIKSKDKIWGKSRTLEPVINLIVHTDSLPKKTKGIFKSKKGKLSYYLDLSEDMKVNTKSLGYLFWIIFGDEISGELEEDIIDFCYDINSEFDTKLFDKDCLIFTKTKYDDVVSDALTEYFISKGKWDTS